jgi:hypothetical protein
VTRLDRAQTASSWSIGRTAGWGYHESSRHGPLRSLLAWAIEQGETATTLLRHPFYHPTFEEGLKPALREICDAVGTWLAPGLSLVVCYVLN